MTIATEEGEENKMDRCVGIGLKIVGLENEAADGKRWREMMSNNHCVDPR